MSRDDNLSRDELAFLWRADTELVRADAPRPALGPESILDSKWQIKTFLGAGGFGRVFEAASLESPDDHVAIKVVEPETKLDPRWLARFEQEANIALSLDHPNLVSSHAHGTLADGSRYLVMELLEGAALDASLLADGPLPPTSLARLCEGLGRALAALHARGVVHRDVKPANVFLVDADEGRAAPMGVKLMDFGLCKGPRALTASMEQVGTLAYMAPELLTEGSKQATPAADLYAMALTCYEAATARPLLSATSLATLVHEIRAGTARERLLATPAAPPFMTWLARGLATDPLARPGDAAAWGCALAAALRDEKAF